MLSIETITLTPVYHAALGGTMEQLFSVDLDKLVYPEKSIIYEFLRDCNVIDGANFSSDTYCLKESTDITIDDVKKLIRYLTETGKGQIHTQILVTCGLFDIKKIGEMFKVNSRHCNNIKIMLVSSKMQLRDKWYTDAMFNLGTAITYLQYVMQLGEIVSYDCVGFNYHLKKITE